MGDCGLQTSDWRHLRQSRGRREAGGRLLPSRLEADAQDAIEAPARGVYKAADLTTGKAS